MTPTNIATIRATLNWLKIREEFSSAPPHVEVPLQFVRDMPACEHMNADVRGFLEATSHLPNRTVVRLTKRTLTVVTDGSGNILSFR
jgi:hypothetical protein